MIYKAVRPLVFCFPPEKAHNLTIQLMRLIGAVPSLQKLVRAVFRTSFSGPPVYAFGLVFPNPVGLAAGYDKDGIGWRGLAPLGFGHIEVGTVTPRPQEGKAKPRIFRLVGEEAIINRMGFPSRGSDFLVSRLKARRPGDLILGVNIGKNKETPLGKAVEDYLVLLRTFAPLADYITVNVSSPNTEGLRKLQAKRRFYNLLRTINAERVGLVARLEKPIPLLVKISPDLTELQLEEVLGTIMETEMDGVVVANTSVGRYGLESPLASESGGLSGAPIRVHSTEMVRAVARYTKGALPIVASGGILAPEDALEKLDAGASLVQVFTGLVYSGPGLVADILRSLNPELGRVSALEPAV